MDLSLRLALLAVIFALPGAILTTFELIRLVRRYRVKKIFQQMPAAEAEQYISLNYHVHRAKQLNNLPLQDETGGKARRTLGAWIYWLAMAMDMVVYPSALLLLVTYIWLVILGLPGYGSYSGFGGGIALSGIPIGIMIWWSLLKAKEDGLVETSSKLFLAILPSLFWGMLGLIIGLTTVGGPALGALCFVFCYSLHLSAYYLRQ